MIIGHGSQAAKPVLQRIYSYMCLVTALISTSAADDPGNRWQLCSVGTRNIGSLAARVYGVEPSKSFFVAQLGVCVWLILRSKLVLQHGEAKESGIACVRSDHVAWINCHRPRFTRKLFADTRSMSQIWGFTRSSNLEYLFVLHPATQTDFMGPLQSSTQGALSETPEGTLAIEAASLLKIGILWSQRTSDSRIETPRRTHEIPMKLLALDVLDNLIVLGTQVGEPPQTFQSLKSSMYGLAVDHYTPRELINF